MIVNGLLYVGWMIEYCLTYFTKLGLGLFVALVQAVFNCILLIWLLRSSATQNIPGSVKQILSELFNILSHYVINVVTIVFYLVAVHMGGIYHDTVTIIVVGFPFALFNGLVMLESCIKIFIQLNLFRIELERKVTGGGELEEDFRQF